MYLNNYTVEGVSKIVCKALDIEPLRYGSPIIDDEVRVDKDPVPYYPNIGNYRLMAESLSKICPSVSFETEFLSLKALWQISIKEVFDDHRVIMVCGIHTNLVHAIGYAVLDWLEARKSLLNKQS